MKNGRYFNFRDICNRNLWDTGYLVNKLQGYGILRRPPNGASVDRRKQEYLDKMDIDWSHHAVHSAEMGVAVNYDH